MINEDAYFCAWFGCGSKWREHDLPCYWLSLGTVWLIYEPNISVQYRNQGHSIGCPQCVVGFVGTGHGNFTIYVIV